MKTLADERRRPDFIGNNIDGSKYTFNDCKFFSPVMAKEAIMAVTAGLSGNGICGQHDVLFQPQGLQARRPDDRQRAFDVVYRQTEARHIGGLGRIVALLREDRAINSIAAPVERLADLPCALCRSRRVSGATMNADQSSGGADATAD